MLFLDDVERGEVRGGGVGRMGVGGWVGLAAITGIVYKLILHIFLRASS